MSSSPHEVILTSSTEGPIIAYDSSSGTPLTRFTGSRSPRHGLALVGNIFVAASHISPITASGSIHLYKWWSSTAFHNLPVPEPLAPLAATHDGSYLFAGGLSGSVYALSVPSGDILRSLHVHKKSVSCLRICEDSLLLISGSDDGTIVVIPIFQLVGWSSTNEGMDQSILHKFAAHSGAVTDIISGKGLCNSQIISCSLDFTVKFWSLLRGTHLRTVVLPSAIMGLVLNPSESEFYAAGSDGSVYKGSINVGSRRIPTSSDQLVRWAQNHNGAIVSLAMVNSGRNLVSASEDGCVNIWKVDGGQVVWALGNELGSSISDLVVATGISCVKDIIGSGLSRGELDGVRVGLRGRQVMMSSLPVKETVEIEEVLTLAEKDRSRAIDMLKSAIAMYERLLELILKEAKGTSSREVTREREKYT